jgi:hypothetical protein
MLAIVLGLLSFTDEVSKPAGKLVSEFQNQIWGSCTHHRGHPYWAKGRKECRELWIGDATFFDFVNFLATSFKKSSSYWMHGHVSGSALYP